MIRVVENKLSDDETTGILDCEEEARQCCGDVMLMLMLCQVQKEGRPTERACAIVQKP